MLAQIGRSYPAPARGDVLQVRNLTSPYESASQRLRVSGWFAPRLGPNDALLGSLATMRDRSRAARRNDPYARKIIRILVSEMLGTGIVPRSAAQDADFRRAVDTLWERSAPELDADGVLDVYGQQAQGVACWLEAGEVFMRQRPRTPQDGLTVPIQFQLLEPEFCPHDQDGQAQPAAGNIVRAGIERSPIGRRVAYHMLRARPSSTTDLNQTDRVRVPADTVSHLYVPERVGQLRGIPTLNQSLVTLRDLNGTNDAVLLRQRLANLFLGWIESASTPTDAEGNALDPVTGKVLTRDPDDGAAAITLEPGSLLSPPLGQTLKFNDPPQVGQEYEAFNRQYLRQLAAGAEVPYHSLTGDMAQVNDRTIRVIVQEFRRSLEQLQWLYVIPQFCMPLWRAWFDTAILFGALSMPVGYADDPDLWRAVEWTPQAWSYIQPVQDVDADILRVRGGFASRSQVVRERGYDPEAIDQERADDDARADALGLVLDTDPRRVQKTGAPAAQPEPPADQAAATATLAALDLAREAVRRPIEIHSPITIAEGAIKAPDVVIAEGAVRVETPVIVHPSDVHVDAPVTIAKGAVHVEAIKSGPTTIRKKIMRDQAGRPDEVIEQHTPGA